MEDHVKLLAPTLFLLDIEFKFYLETHIDELIDKYRESIFKNENSQAEIRTYITQAIAKCLIKISKSNYKQIRRLYTDDGISTIMFDHLYSKLVSNVSIG